MQAMGVQARTRRAVNTCVREPNWRKWVGVRYVLRFLSVLVSELRFGSELKGRAWAAEMASAADIARGAGP